MSEWAIIRAYMMITWRGLAVTAMAVFWLLMAVEQFRAPDEVGPLTIPLLGTLWLALDFWAFRRTRRFKG